MKGAKLLVLLVTLAAVVLPSQAQKPKVEIFYETLNEPVRRLFVEQYRSVFDSLNDKINLRLFPYGRTAKVGDKYTCDSDLQCEANKIHACLIKAEIIAENPTDVDQEINQISASNFVQCFFKNRKSIDDVEELGNQCMPGDASADWGEIRDCVFTDDTITSQFETVSEPVKNELAKTGLVVRVDGTSVDLTTTSLAGAICGPLTDPKPDICTQAGTPATKVKIGVFYEAQSPDANKYLDKQLGNFYHVIEDFVDIDLVPYGNTVKTGDTYNCTLGTSQCISNKFQALVVDKYLTNPKGDLVSGPNRVVNFVRCLAQSNLGSELTKLEVCSRDFLQVDDYRTFIEFIRMNSEEVKTVFENMRTKTAPLLGEGNTLPRVPTVTVNGQLDYNALDDLVQEACNQTTWIGPKSSICTKIDVVILYEALNQRSRSFFLEHFNPIFHNMYALLNVQLVPAGRSVMVPGNGLTCYNGYDQCIAMELQACAIDNFWNDGNNYTDPIRQEVFDFIWCTFKNKHMRNVMDAAETCANDHIELDAWVTIHGCFIEGMGQILVADNIETTQSMVHDMEHHDVPAVFVNGTNVTDLASIRAIICGFYDIYHQPDICLNDEPSKVDISVYFESTSELSKHFFTTQYDPWYIYIEEMVNIKLFPAGNVRENLGDNGTCDSYEANSTCMSNKIMSMVIDRYSNSDDGDFIPGSLRIMRFLSCLFSHNDFKSNIYNAHEYCSAELPNDEWYDMYVAAKSEEGAKVYAAALAATNDLIAATGQTSLSNIPWVTLNGRNFSRTAQNDLMQTVCQKYGGEKPLECTQVEVTIYYSAVHAQSRRFFIDQLESVYRHLRERIHLQLVPYGPANASSTIDDECSSRTNVCTANKAQACAIKKFFDDSVGENTLQWDGKNQTFAFIRCMYKNNRNQKDIYQLIEDCSNEDFIYGDEITECVKQDEGKNYLSEMRNRTLEQFETMEHAPWIVINGLRSALAQSDLKTAVCDAMIGDRPDFCYEPTPEKVKVEFHYSTLDSKVQSYVVDELYPHYREMEEIIDLDVVPFGEIEVFKEEDGSYKLICPGGVEECHATLIHACVYEEFFHNDDDPISDNFDEFDGKVQVVDFINCYFSSALETSNLVEVASQCVEKTFNDAHSTVMNCATDPVLGPSILSKFQETKVDTLLPHLAYLPWITLDGKHSYTVEHHFPRSVCDAYRGSEKPQDCYSQTDSDAKPVVAIHYEVGDASSKNFFSSLLNGTITSVADITLIPFGRSTYSPTMNCVNDVNCTQYVQHACLINLFYQKYTELTLKTIECTFGDAINAPDVVNQCVNNNLEGIDDSTPDPWEAIHACVLEQGDALMNANQELVAALTPRISHVPWVTVQGEHDPEAEDSLLNEICGYWYPSDKPAACQPALINVAIYYETNNTDAASWFLTQTSQFVEYLDEFAQFSLIPYGKTVNNGGQLVCPNSNEQCIANAFHACVINRYYNHSSVNPASEFEKNRIRTAGFIECTFFHESQGQVNAEDNAEICFNQIFGVDSRDILSCAIGDEGKTLLAELGRQTSALSPPLSSIPVVTIAGKQSQDAQNFFQRLCNTYGNVRPGQCSSLPNPAVKVGVYFSGDQQGIDYLSTQLFPFYQDVVPVLREDTPQTKLYDMLSPDLVAWGTTTYNPDNTDDPFSCKGANECYINRFFACANHYHGQEPRAQRHLLALALCFANNTAALVDPSEVFNGCVNRIWLPDPFPTLETCATSKSNETYEIFLKAKQKTDNNYPALTTFPSVTINNMYNADASKYLLYVVCNNYGGDRPSACENAENPGPTTPVSTVTGPVSTVTSPVTVTIPTLPSGSTPTAPTGPTQTPTGSTPQPTTPAPGSGTTPVISIFILFVSLFISRWML